MNIAGATYTQENGKLGNHKNKSFMSVVSGLDGRCIVGTSDGDLLQFQGELIIRYNIYCIILYYTVLYYIILYYIILYYNKLYCIILYCIFATLHYTVLYCTVLYCTLQYCTALYVTYLCYAILQPDMICCGTL